MAFAIVRFTEEGDAPDIVPTNWICEDNCWYPNVKSEETKKKLVIARETPGRDWLECPIRLLKEFPNYRAARSHLRQAEYSSNLESETECRKPRKRKIIFFPGEESTCGISEKDVTIKKSRKPYSSSIKIDSYPAPPRAESETASHDVIRESSDETSVETCNNEGGVDTITQVPENSISFGLHNIPAPKTGTQEPLTAEKSSVQSAMIDKHELDRSIKSIKSNQATMWSVLSQLSTSIDKVHSKLDQLFLHMQDGFALQEPEQHLISSLPLGLDDFVKLDEKLQENSSFRKRLMDVLMIVGGTNCKTLASNILRRIIVDDVGEKFSLTEVCSHRCEDTKENFVREAISDWLMQAKFRKMRKQNRQEI